MKKYFNTAFARLTMALSLLIVIISCETTDLDINDNPNALTPQSADPNFVLNGIQLTFGGQHLGLSLFNSDKMRHVSMFGTYASNAGQASMNGAWTNTYSIANNLNLIEGLNVDGNLAYHVGVGQVLEAFAFINLVDNIGTAVYSEAVSSEFPQPNLDSGESIYDAMYLQLDNAIANLSVSDAAPFEDLYFDGDLEKWVKLANTLKIKMYVQTKLVRNSNATNEVNAILSSGSYIKDLDDDFMIRFGNSVTNPDTRHPFFAAEYINNAGGQYMSNDFMNTLLNDKAVIDPRLRFYIYRQDLGEPSGTLLPCAEDPDYQYCYAGQGYWGRDHADDEGIPNDGELRSTYGIYPGGGAYDDARLISVIEQEAEDTYVPNPDDPDFTLEVYTAQLLRAENPATANSSNLGGAGIHPMILASFTKFMLAEAALPAPVGLGANGDSKAYLMEAIQDSFNKVEAFAGEDMSIDDVNTYMDEVMTDYDEAASDEEKLAIIIKEYYIAMWGNSLEAYNNYRRTGYPELGFSVISNTAFPRSYFLPESELNANDNPLLEQKELTDRVFWDTNPAGFID